MRNMKVLWLAALAVAMTIGIYGYAENSGMMAQQAQQGGVVPTASPSATASPGVTPSPSVSPGAGATPAAAVTPAGVTVQIPANAAGQGAAAFGQNPLVVPVGTTVTWVNNDSVPHTATSDTGVWDSGTLAPGQSFSFTFNTPGTFSYFCMIHGRQSMSGVIQVQ